MSPTAAIPKRDFEYAFWKARLTGAWKAKVSILPYIPEERQAPPRSLPINSAWAGIETILRDMTSRFQLGHGRCLEFGVELGFSAVALSSYFDSVLGVDTFQGDKHTAILRDYYAEALDNVRPFGNIQLIRSNYESFIEKNDGFYDLIHVDIIHTYSDTFRCGLWSAERSRCTIFHDTESFPEVRQAVKDIARRTGKKFYNFKESYGLGILI